MKLIYKSLILVSMAAGLTHLYRARLRRRALGYACWRISNGNENWTGQEMQALINPARGGFDRQVTLDERTAIFLLRMHAIGCVVLISKDPTAPHPLTSRWQLTTRGRYACQRMAFRKLF